MNVYLGHGQWTLKNDIGYMEIADNVNYVLCISNYYKDFLCRDCNCNPDKIFICGQPRNDVMFSEQNKCPAFLDIKKYKKTVLWLPTFSEGQTFDNIFSMIPLLNNSSCLSAVDDYLKKHSMLLIIKFQPRYTQSLNSNFGFTNIRFLTHSVLSDYNLSINGLYPFTDALISDYSSASADYSLLDKPMAFISYPEYERQLDQELYSLFTPGYKIHSYGDFVSFLEDIYYSRDCYAEKRRELASKAHEFKDGNNCKRIEEFFGLEIL